MNFPNHVRRNVPNHPQFDSRMQSNPQSIPRNTGLAPTPRGGNTTPTNYQYNTPGQSPQHAQYVTPPTVYAAVNPSEIGSSHNQVASSTKQHANGQPFVWQGQRMQYAPQHPPGQHQNLYPSGAPSKFTQQHVQNSGPFQYQQSSSTNPPYVYVNSAVVRAARFQQPHSVVTQTPQPIQGAAPPAYYQAPYYPTQMPSVPYPAQYEHMPFQQGTQQAIANPVIPHPVPAQPAATHKTKAIKIINPDTMQEVAVEPSRSSTRTESESSTHSRSSPTAVTPQSQQKDQIAVQFAAKVAIVASDHDKPRQISSSSEVNQVISSDVDTSVHPHSNQTPAIQNNQSPPIQVPVQENVAANDSAAIPETKRVSNGTSVSSHLVTTSANRSTAPIAVVQPLAHPSKKTVDLHDVEIPMVKETKPAPRIEKILSRGEALPPLKDSKDVVDVEESINDEVFKPEKPSEAITIESTESKTNIEPTIGAKTSESAPASSPSEVTNAKEDNAIPEKVTIESQISPTGKAPSLSDVEPAKPESAKPAVETDIKESTKATEEADAPKPDPVPAAETKQATDTKVPDKEGTLEAKALSGGDSAVKENSDKTKPSAPEVKSQLDDSKPDVVQVAPPVKSQSSRDASSQKEKEKPELISKLSSAEVRLKKVQYERDFLIKCRDHESTREKPSLPNLPDIVMDQCLPNVPTSLPSIGTGFGGGSDFTPNWMSRNPRVERQTSRGSQGGQGRQGYGYSQQMQPQKIIKKVSIQREPEAQLNKAENAWKPSKMENKKSTPATTEQTGKLSEEEQTAVILKTVRSILNKLTPQKFTPLMQKFRDLPITTENHLREVINLIFEKAIDEPNFCEAYANMCRVMSQYRVTAPGSEGANPGPAAQPVVVFRKVLLTRCQKEFEKDRASENKLCELRKKLEEAPAEEKKSRKEELDIVEGKERRRIMGNIRFIGELFRLGMLTEHIMHNCIMSLFRARDEESLESLCKLLTTIGKDLDHVKGKHLMDQYFSQIDKIIKEKRISPRVKFMLRDVEDLRKCNWVQRAIKAQGPKTIDQIHQDAKEEKEQMALKTAAAPPVKSQSRGSRGGMGSRNSSSHNLSEDGWQNVSQKPMRIDPQKMKFSKIDESNVTLGPNRGKWKSGSGSGATKTGSGGLSYRDMDGIQAPRSITPTTMNRFSALSGAGSQETFYANRHGGRISSQERTKSGSRGSGESRNPGRDERQSALETVRRLTSAERKPRGSGASPPVKPPSPVNEVNEAALSKINSTIKEYLHLQDIKEATECFEEVGIPPSMGHVIVKACLESSIEKSSKDRASVSRLLCSLIKNEKLSTEQYVKGVVDNMELAVDLELDLPKIWTCLAEIVADVFHHSAGKVALSCLTDMAKPLFEYGKADVFVIETLKKLIAYAEPALVVKDWRTSNLQMEYFMPSVDPSTISSTLERHGLLAFYDDAITVEASGNVTSSSPQKNFNDLVADISKQLEKHSKPDPMFDWVEATTTPQERSLPFFVRALTTAVCNKAIVQNNEKFEVDKELVTSRSILLRKFLDNDDKELQALYALQKLYVDLDQPPNVLKLLFDFLYDEEVISEETFFKWEKSDDPDECDGKGVAVTSVNSFLTWLRQAEVESDE